MTRNGRFVVVRQPDGVDVVDVLGPRPRRRLGGPVGVVACIGDEVWWGTTSAELRREALIADEPLASVSLGEPVLGITDTGSGAIVQGEQRSWLVGGGTVTEIEAARVVAAAGRRIVEADGETATIRMIGRHDGAATMRLDGVASAGAFVLGGRAVALWIRGAASDSVVVLTVTGKRIHQLALPALSTCAFADDGNLAIACTSHDVSVIDLRVGRVRATRSVDRIDELAVDRLGRTIVATVRQADGTATVSRTSVDDLCAGLPAPAAVVDEAPVVAPDLRDEVPCAPACEAPAAPDEAVPARPPLALAPPSVAVPALLAIEAQPYRDAGEHLAALLDVIAARTALAIAEGWHSGRTSHDGDGDLPCEREVLGLIGEDVGLAAGALRAARMRLFERARELSQRTEASVAAGLTLPFHTIAREHALSTVATQILACAAAPRLRTSIARLYGVLAGVQGRSACADHVLEALVETEPGHDVANAIAVELAPDAVLVVGGLVLPHWRGERLEVAVDPVLVDRLRGIVREHQISNATVRRTSARPLTDVRVPASVKRALVLGLAERDPDRPARIVVRGRRGSGRHTVIAALAAEVGRDIAEVDASLLGRGPELSAALASELRRAALAGCVPVVSGLEGVPREGDAWLLVRTAIAQHRGPLAVRTTPDAELPIGPDHIEVELPPLALGERAAAWRAALSARGVAALDEDALALLATRFRFGPGTIERVVAQAVKNAACKDGLTTTMVDTVARQHIASRLARVATRVTRLPDWDQVTLIDEMRDSVRELVGRMRHQRTVYEEWGYDDRLTTARGLTALFYGPPGTGKTLVAGLIGRELGLDVWRIDLARVVSKWIGETEKSLAEVFEAAEEGQVLLLFDEADSLFGKRSEVKSSNDRYANLETNYLLQRLDSFEGVAILTTNLEGSIDPAFKRRLSMRLYFAFPDDEQRERLWAAHVPPGVPREGLLDFAELARRYPLSGGYIRNSALRAAFLAAQENRPLAQDHLVRAVQLEYRELGKLSTNGRMD